MKLISCHIENFGNLSDVDYKFEDNLNPIYGINGYGKSTLTSFILAMLYGMDSYTTLDINKNNVEKDRLHYNPFQGGNFGGNLLLEKDNKQYRIEARFDSKTNTKDEIKLLDENNHEINLNNKTVGEYLLHVNKETFTSTILISQDRLDVSMSADVASKLSNLIDVNSSSDDYEKAIEKISKMINDTKKEIKENQLKINENDKNLISFSKDFENYDSKENEYKLANEELIKADEKLNEAYKMNDINNLFSKLDEKNDYLNLKKKEKEIIEKKYPKGLISKEEIQIVNEDSKELITLKMDVSFTDEDNKKLESLSKEFKENIPTNEELISIKEEIEQYNYNKRNLEGTKPTLSEELRIKFEGKGISLSKYESDVEPLVKKLENMTGNITTTFSKPSPLFYVLIGLGGLSLIAGIICIIVKAMTLGIVLALIGMAALIASMFIYIGKKNAPVNNSNVNEINEKLQDILSTYYYKTSPILTNINLFHNDLIEYEKNKQKIEEFNKNTSIFNRNHIKIEELLTRFDIEKESIYNDSSLLINKLEKYNELAERKSKYDCEGSKLKEKKEKLTNDIDSIFNKYDIVKEDNLDIQLLELNTSIDRYNNLVNDIKQKEEEISLFIKNNHLENRPELVNINIEDLKKDFDEKQKTLNVIKDEIKHLDDVKESIDKLEEYNSRLNEINEELESKKSLYESTHNALVESKSNLINKYVEPIKIGYIKYANILSVVLSSNPTIDEKLNITYEVNGENRSSKYLSDGQKSLCNLCIRLALIDEMYKNDLPFIVLDDPFTNLDENNLKTVNTILADLFKDKQVIYFYCHKSREIK